MKWVYSTVAVLDKNYIVIDVKLFGTEWGGLRMERYHYNVFQDAVPTCWNMST